MPELLLPRSPLAVFPEADRKAPPPARPGLKVSERPFLGYLNLRGQNVDLRFVRTAEQSLGIAIPVRPNTFAENDRATILWLGPSEWMIVTEAGSEIEIAQKLREDLSGIFSAVTDVTHNQTTIRIRGDRVLDVLRKGCRLDLHPATFGPGCCSQTLLSKVGVVIRWVNRSPVFDLIVRRSFAEYLALWIEDAAHEYGFAVD